MFASSKNLENTVSIVCAFVARNAISAAELPPLIERTSAALRRADTPAAPVAKRPKPPQTIFDDFIICLEDGKPFRSLKRHLWKSYGLSPEAYRRKWGLPDTYPMSAPSFSHRRSQAARARALGKHARGGEGQRHA